MFTQMDTYKNTTNLLHLKKKKKKTHYSTINCHINHQIHRQIFKMTRIPILLV